MNIYHVERTDSGGGYDTYSDFVIIAKDEEQARRTNPSESGKEVTEKISYYDEWVKYSQTKATLLGKASDDWKITNIICSSYHAG